MNFFGELKRRNVFRVGAAYMVASWLLLQVADVLIQTLGLPEATGKYVFLLLAIGFVPVLIFAWAYEMTPEGLKRDRDVMPERSAAQHTARKLDKVTIALLLAVLAVVVIDRLLPERAAESVPEPATVAEAPARTAVITKSKRSLAVLPFRVMSSGADDEYFADGLTEEILNSLAQLPELLVTARTSAFHFKGQDIPVPEIAAVLGVENVVEGSVRRGGDTVRITAQLVRAGDGFHLWSQTYDRSLEDVLAVQEDIAGNIAATLDVVLDESKLERMRNAGIRNVDAFIAYQKALKAFARAHENMQDVTRMLHTEALPLFEQVLASAPDLIAARILKADVAGHRVFDLAGGIGQEAFPGETEAVLESLRREYQEAWRVAVPGNQRDILDVERTLFSDDWSGLDARFERALQPGNCSMSSWTLEMAVAAGWAPKALAKTAERLRCDPLDATAQFTHTHALLWNGQPRAAVEAAENAQSLGVTYLWMEDALFYALLAAGELDDPRVVGAAGPQSWMRFPREILPLALRGDAAAARALAEEFWSGPAADDWSSLIVAASIGDHERANAHAARIDARPGGPFILLNSVYTCSCGAPFDLDAAPKFGKQIERAGIHWPPAAPIAFPGKDW